MIKAVVKIVAIAGLTLAALFICSAAEPAIKSIQSTNVSTASSIIPVPTPVPAPATNQLKETSTGTTIVQPGVMEQFGPPGVLLTTALTGILMIFRTINDGKRIDVATYKERASDAEKRSDEEIGKVHKKLEEMNAKLDEVIADRDEYRNSLEERKANFTQQILAQEKRHQRELEDMHAALMIEVHVRHKLERLLAENDIPIPDTPPPYTRKMRAEVTPEEEKEVDDAMPYTSQLPLIAAFEE